MKCKSCGKEIGADTRFCIYCGTPVRQSNDECGNFESSVDNADKKPQVKCPICGKHNKASYSFCIYCGASVLTDKKSSVKKVGRVLAALMILIAVLLAALVVYDFICNRRVEKEIVETGVVRAEEKTASFVDGMEDAAESETKGSVEQFSMETVERDRLELMGIDDVSDAASTEDEEHHVNQIIGCCSGIVSDIESGAYEKITIATGTVAYYDTDNLKSIIQSGNGGLEYTNSYYYNDNMLIYACYESSGTSKVFYFSEGKLIRWGYLSSEGDVSQVETINNSNAYFELENSVLAASQRLVGDWNVAIINKNAVREYILEGSDSRYISKSELNGFTKEECRLARNELYARHGRKFEDEELRGYFNQFDWYYPTIESRDFKESMLNDYETANRDLIVEYEEEHGYR